MKKIIFAIGMTFLTTSLFCDVVKSAVLTSKYGISYAERQKSNYIEKNGYSFRYLGNGSWDVKTLTQYTSSSKKDSSAGTIVFFLIAGIIIVVLVKKYMGTVKDVKMTDIDKEALITKYKDTEETIKEYNTYNTNLTNQDIVLIFPENVLTYLSEAKFYICDYSIYKDNSDQNYAWNFKIIKNIHKWGTIYTLWLLISNGFFCIKTSGVDFVSGDKNAKSFFWQYEYKRREVCDSIIMEFKSFLEESFITMKQYNTDYEIPKPLFSVVREFLPELSIDRKRIIKRWLRKQNPDQVGSNKRRHTVETGDIAYQFYRKLLGLDEQFTQNKLKETYRIYAVKYHPDQYANADAREKQHAEDIMKQINEAYEYLKDYAT